MKLYNSIVDMLATIWHLNAFCVGNNSKRIDSLDHSNKSFRRNNHFLKTYSCRRAIPIKGISPFLHFFQKWDICNGDRGKYYCGNLKYHRFFEAPETGHVLNVSLVGPSLFYIIKILPVANDGLHLTQNILFPSVFHHNIILITSKHYT